jgi:7,8-dihydropterin-6-yl-methyl-4-(beta-D-ribofuranosyl)aminobenzene 5'-phosphate synthase
MSDYDHKEFPISRRPVLCGGGASVLSALIASLLGGARPVRAEAVSGSVPEVDELAVRVVIDNY